MTPCGLLRCAISLHPRACGCTPHAAFGAPYPRNVKGNAVMLDIFLSPPREALPLLESLGVAYVTFCPGSPERYTYAAVAPDGLAAALSRGAIPDRLRRTPLDGIHLAA